MSFDKSVFSTRFIQKTIKVDLHVIFNRAYLQRNGHQKTLEDSRGLHTEAEPECLLGGARLPHLVASRPPLWCGVISSQPSDVRFAVDKRN